MVRRLVSVSPEYDVEELQHEVRRVVAAINQVCPTQLERPAANLLQGVTDALQAESERADEAERGLEVAEASIKALEAKLNTPELQDFAAGVVVEAQHQRHRWGAEHDVGKSPWDWFWLIGYLAQKAAAAAVAGDVAKALHHTIAAALANWHASLSGVNDEMRPGIAQPSGEVS